MAAGFVVLVDDSANIGKKVACNTFTWNGQSCYAQILTIGDPATGTGASISAAGASGTNALAIQGITGGVPIPVSATLTLPFPGNVDAQAPSASGQGVSILGFNGTAYDRLRSDSNRNLIVGLMGIGGTEIDAVLNPGDAFAAASVKAAQVYAVMAGFNGTSYDRVRLATVGAPASSGGGILTAQGIAMTGALQASGAQIATGNSGAGLAVGALRELVVFINVSATSGTNQTADFYIQAQDPVSSNWCDIGAHIQVAGTGTSLNTPQQLNTPIPIQLGAALQLPFGSQLRVRWEINGSSPSFTFSIGYAGKN